MITSTSSISEVLAFLSENELVLEARREKPRRFVVTLSDAATGGYRWRYSTARSNFGIAFDDAMKEAEKAAPLFGG